MVEATDWLCNAFGFTVRLRIGDHRAQLVFGAGAVIVTELDETEADPATHSIHLRALRPLRRGGLDAHLAHRTQSGRLRRVEEGFDNDPVGREEGGVRRYRLLRPTDDPNYAIVDLEFDSSGEAEAFRAKLSELWGRVGGDLGLQSLQARILELVEGKEY